MKPKLVLTGRSWGFDGIYRGWMIPKNCRALFSNSPYIFMMGERLYEYHVQYIRQIHGRKIYLDKNCIRSIFLSEGRKK